MEAHHNVENWYVANKECFAPPICNLLMHKGQISVMWVGGPNQRKDFHIDESSEFFWQMKGNMELPTIQNGVRKLVKIRQGQVFLLPSRIPHSPQRPEPNSLGLVIERERNPEELDGLAYYTDPEKCDEVLWEKYFHCDDLRTDLIKIVQEFRESSEFKTGIPSMQPPLQRTSVQEMGVTVPDPFNLDEWIEQHRVELMNGKSLNLFEGHPDDEFSVLVIGGPSKQELKFNDNDTFLIQLEGSISVQIDDSPHVCIKQGECGVVPKGREFVVVRESDSIGIMIQQYSHGNKRRAN